MTVPGAVEVIRELAKNSPADVLVGAGTVLNAEVARRCLDAGAQFLVSPGLNLQVIHLAVAEGKLMMAGALTPTEVITAWEAGSEGLRAGKPGVIVENARKFLAVVKEARARMTASAAAKGSC